MVFALARRPENSPKNEKPTSRFSFIDSELRLFLRNLIHVNPLRTSLYPHPPFQTSVTPYFPLFAICILLSDLYSLIMLTRSARALRSSRPLLRRALGARGFSSSDLIPDEPTGPKVVTDNVPGPKGIAAVSRAWSARKAVHLLTGETSCSQRKSILSKTRGRMLLYQTMNSPKVCTHPVLEKKGS